MVRGPDAVDLGAWRGRVAPDALVVPLDTHVHRVARCIGLTRRRDASWRTAEEITEGLRRVDPADPVRFDFALCHLGMSGACPARTDRAACAACPLAPACRTAARLAPRNARPVVRRAAASGGARARSRPA
jgi:endonuclease III